MGAELPGGSRRLQRHYPRMAPRPADHLHRNRGFLPRHPFRTNVGSLTCAPSAFRALRATQRPVAQARHSASRAANRVRQQAGLCSEPRRHAFSTHCRGMGWLRIRLSAWCIHQRRRTTCCAWPHPRAEISARTPRAARACLKVDNLHAPISNSVEECLQLVESGRAARRGYRVFVRKLDASSTRFGRTPTRPPPQRREGRLPSWRWLGASPSSTSPPRPSVPLRRLFTLGVRELARSARDRQCRFAQPCRRPAL